MDKKYQVFVSSTYQDLVEERQAVSRSILDMGHIPAGMELFPAADVEQLAYIKKVIDECDYYILIIGGRYGSLGSDGISFTEQEYNYAIATKKPVLAFVHADAGSIAFAKSEPDPEKRSKLDAFIGRVMQGRIVQKWRDAADLRANAIVSLQRAFNEMPQVGWVRADTTSSEIRQRILEYRERISDLEDQLSRPAVASAVFEDVANLSQEVTVSYTVFAPGTLSEKFKLGQILLVIGDTLMEGASLDDVSSDIRQAITDRHGITIQGVSKADVRTVTTTLIAAGLVELRNNDGLREYFLTRAGEAAWVQVGYVKSAGN